ncbi:26S proteasome complex subunit DSS1 [Smittium culicis]|uniref:26S proteasome complex subunit SEM1 n=1 Tax=Smittium culicis TaxID=133412 RepID=A0A1R1YI79_9FUNG|nr:26S proteasome complex subunit DSS1 [Smittium culicis]
MEVVNEAEQEKILSNLDEDVEFEEFEAEDWSEDEKDKEDLNLWEEDWDDDDLEDDFSKQLRAELEKTVNPFGQKA